MPRIARGEAQTLGGKFVHVGCEHVLGTVAAEISVTEIVIEQPVNTGLTDGVSSVTLPATNVGSSSAVQTFTITIAAPLPVEVQANATSTTYATLKGAFDAINLGTHTGAIVILLHGDTDEGTATATLNASGAGAASYTSITLSPADGAARTITGATTAGSPLIDLNGADNVTINGLNSGGNTLTIANTTASSTSGTSTVRFISGATNNTITNCNLQGSGSTSTAVSGAIVLFSTDAVTGNGNDANTLSNNNIGPAGARDRKSVV